MRSPTVSDQVLQTQIALTCQQFGVLSVSSLAADAVGSILFYGKVPLATILGWLAAAIVGAVLVPWVMLAIARKKDWKFHPARRWTTVLIAVGFLSGSVGSAGVFLFLPDSIIEQQFLLILLLAGTSLTMVLFVEELQARSRDRESQRILGNLKRSMDSMQELFNSLLDVSRLEWCRPLVSSRTGAGICPAIPYW